MGKRTSALAALALAFCTALGFNSTARAAEPAGAQWNMPWDQPPAEFREMEKRGFHDGVQGAMKDYDHHRFPDVDRRSEYKHPHVDTSLREDYRRGFRRGYDDAMKHLMATNSHHS